MNAEFLMALDTLQKEKNIDKQELIEAIELSIASAYKKNYGTMQDVEVVLDQKNGEIKVYVNRTVVADVLNEETEMALADAVKIDKELQIGDICKVEVAPKDFGRIAAQNAKQLIFQRIKEAERNIVYNTFLEKQDELINAVVTRVDNNLVYVDVGSSEAILLPSEQIPGEVFRAGQHIRVYMMSVKRTTKGSQINVSRTHPGMVKRLFEEEVPEIYDGVIEIVTIAREPGSRTKIAVKANNPSIDPVGACVGQRGVRVQNIINELHGEKIDVIKYSDDVRTYLANALSPAGVQEILLYKGEKMALAVVDDFQYSLAIGREGQNVRLAAKLTGWKIDIYNATDFAKMEEENPNFRDQFRSRAETEASLDELKESLDKILDFSADEKFEDHDVAESEEA